MNAFDIPKFGISNALVTKHLQILKQKLNI